MRTAGGPYSLQARGASFTLGTARGAPFRVAPARPTRMIFVTTPPGVAIAGRGLPALVVEVQDRYGNRAAVSDTVELAPLCGHGRGHVLLGPSRVRAIGGRAVFVGATLVNASADCRLRALSVERRMWATSAPFRVLAAPADALHFDGELNSTVVAGEPSAVLVTLSLRDAFGNVVPTATARSVDLGLSDHGSTNRLFREP